MLGRVAATLACLATALAAGCAGDETPVTIGVLPECRGYSAGANQPLLGAAELPLLERGARKAGDDPSDGLLDARVAGREIELVFGCEPAEQHPYDSVYSLLEVRRLVEREHAEIVVVSSGEPWTLELAAYAARHPEVTFVTGWGYTQSATLRDDAPNLVSFYPNALQQVAAAGAYAYRRLGWRRAVIVHDDHAWGWTEAAGFSAPFCALGGTIVDRVWVPQTGAFDPKTVAARVRDLDVDGVFLGNGDVRVVTALADGVPLLRGNMSDELIGTWWSLGDNSIHLALGKRLEGVFTTMAGSAPAGESLPENARYWKRYTATWPGQAAFWALHGAGVATYTAMSAVVAALERVGGDLGESARNFQRALYEIELDGPNGRLRLDEHGQVIATGWYTKRRVVNKERNDVVTLPPVAGIDTTLGGLIGRDSAPPSRNGVPCRKAPAPAWASKIGG